jgi:hypothetical protein
MTAERVTEVPRGGTPSRRTGITSVAGLSLRWIGASRVRSQQGKGVDMSDKSPRKTATKKSGKSLKEKRQAKKDKEQTRKEFGR